MLADLKQSYAIVRMTLNRACDMRDPERIAGLLNGLIEHVAKMERQLDAIDSATLGTRLRTLRAQAGVNQTTVAEAVGISQSALSKLEHDAGKRDLDVILALAEYFNVPATYLLSVAAGDDLGRMA